jgi:thiamine pyrophosphate-dependent acetolactate synthase large subunit-like protein
MHISKQAVDPAVIPFCYPNVNYSDKIVRMVQNTDCNLAETTQKGWNCPGAHPYILQRIGIHQEMTSTGTMFGYRIVGIL